MHLPHIFKPILTCLAFIVLSFYSIAQDDEPKDYLSKEFHQGRRNALRQIMPDNSLMVIFSYPERKFSNDVDYLYHANPDMYYFSGYKEPNGVLLIFKDKQVDAEGKSFNEVLFVQKRNPMSERWTGKRLGSEQALTQLGFQKALNSDDFKNFPIDFTSFDQIIYQLPVDMEIGNKEGPSLSGLVASFYRKSGFEKKEITQTETLINQIVENANWEDFPMIKEYIQNNILKDSVYAGNKTIIDFTNVSDSTGLESWKKKHGNKEDKFDSRLYNQLTGKLREIKTPEEKILLRKAVEISCQGQNEVMKAVHPDMSELEIQGLHEFVHKKHGAEYVGYGSIIGSGENGCILHYMTNTKTRIGENMVLMDVGAEYHGYTADVTRTIPAKGKFSAEERIIYQLVYDAQEAAFKTLKDSSSWGLASKAASEVLANGLLKLGIIKDKKEISKYYPHGLGHHIGMDVHDRSNYGVLEKDMVISIEPGIYIPSNSDCDKKWWGIAVRIEDNVLITKEGYELLSKFAPRKIEEIEKMISQKSAIDDFKLPPLESGKKKGF